MENRSYFIMLPSFKAPSDLLISCNSDSGVGVGGRVTEQLVEQAVCLQREAFNWPGGTRKEVLFSSPLWEGRNG
jgi:hypothetical protein